MMLQIDTCEITNASPLLRNLDNLGWMAGFCIFSNGGSYGVAQTLGNAHHTLPVDIYIAKDLRVAIEQFGTLCMENPDTKMELSVTHAYRDGQEVVYAIGISRV